MSKTLEARILKLEAAQNRAVEEGPVLFLEIYSGDGGYGEAIGIEINDTLIEREPGESVEALESRAFAGAKGKQGGKELTTYCFRRVRANGSYVPPPVASVVTVAGGTESKPEEPKPEPQRAIPRPAPKEEIIILEGSLEKQHGNGSPWGFMA